MNVPTGQTPAADSDRRPGLAMIANCMTPYRAHLHALLAAGIPEFKLHTLVTHGPAEFDWAMQIPSSIHATYYNNPGDSPLHWLPHKPVREWRKGDRLIDYLRANDVRIVICAGYQYLSYQRLIRNCHRLGIPLFTHNDSNIRSERSLSPPEKWLKQRVYSLWIPKVVGAMSMGELGDQFYRKYGISAERIYRMPCTPDYERYAHVDPHDLQEFRRKFTLSTDRHYLLFSGRLVDVKRVDLLIEAFAALADERPNWDLLIVGDGLMRDELKRRVPAQLTIARHLDRIFGTIREHRRLSCGRGARAAERPRTVGPGDSGGDGRWTGDRRQRRGGSSARSGRGWPEWQDFPGRGCGRAAERYLGRNRPN